MTVVDWAPEVNLREADVKEVIRTEVTSSNISAGTISLDVVTFTPTDPFEVLAVGLHVLTSVTSDATATVPPRAARQRHAFVYMVTTLDTANEAADRAGDYFALDQQVRASEAFEDETNGTGGVSPGSIADTFTIFDPGRDSAESPLVVDENETIRVHKAINNPGIAADEEAVQLVEFMVWGEEVPREETEVRTSFPSRGSGPSV